MRYGVRVAERDKLLKPIHPDKTNRGTYMLSEMKGFLARYFRQPKFPMDVQVPIVSAQTATNGKNNHSRAR